MMQTNFGSNTYDMQASAYGATKCMDRESDVTG